MHWLFVVLTEGEVVRLLYFSTVAECEAVECKANEQKAGYEKCNAQIIAKARV